MPTPATEPYRELLNILAAFEARISDDTAKTDLELTCSRCERVVCDVEADDGLDVLAAAALEHLHAVCPA